MIDDIFTIIFGIALVIGTLALAGFLGALLIIWLWPLIIPAIFPGLVESGMISGDISFWTAFGLSILCQVFFKSNNNNNNKG